MSGSAVLFMPIFSVRESTPRFFINWTTKSLTQRPMIIPARISRIATIIFGIMVRISFSIAIAGPEIPRSASTSRAAIVTGSMIRIKAMMPMTFDTLVPLKNCEIFSFDAKRSVPIDSRNFERIFLTMVAAIQPMAKMIAAAINFGMKFRTLASMFENGSLRPSIFNALSTAGKNNSRIR